MIRSDIHKLITEALIKHHKKAPYQDDNMNKAWEQGFRYACDVLGYYLPREKEKNNG